LPNIDISGGIKAVFEFANYLQKMGNEVSVVYPLVPLSLPGERKFNIKTLLKKIKGTILNFGCGRRLEWFDLKARLGRVPTFFCEQCIPDGDIVVATWWATAYCVKRYNRRKGEKFYLVQHYETWGGPEESVNKSYKLGLRAVVNSTWLEKLLLDKFQVGAEALIFHAPDTDFYPEERRRDRGDFLRILIPYRQEEWKGSAEGILAFRIAGKKHPNLKLVMFGPIKDSGVPDYAEFYLSPDRNKLREIYNSCDIFVFPSRCEGFGLPPMEAMACRRPVVTTNVGAVPDYAIPEKTALISPPASPEALAQNIIRLVEDEKLREEIAEAGYNHIVKNFSWEKAAGELERVFKKYAGR